MIRVFGDVILDSYLSGEVTRISPEAPVPVLLQKSYRQSLGGAANVAKIIANNGQSVSLYSSIFDDTSGKTLQELSKLEGITAFFYVEKCENSFTPHKTRIIGNNNQICRIDLETALPNVRKHFDEIASHLNTKDIIVFSDYAKGYLAGCADILLQINRMGGIVLVDPKSSNLSDYNNIFLIKPNKKEFLSFCFKHNLRVDDQSLDSMALAAGKLLEQYEIQHMLITLNRDGALLVSKDGNKRHYKQKPVEVSDVTGAGDTVLAFLAMELKRGKKIENAIGVSLMASRISVKKFGTEPVIYDELFETKIHGNRLEFIEDMLKQRRRGRKIVFTNGCFDILHAGHVSYLKEAKKLGDILIVAVNSDSSVTRLKGAGRPVNTLADRIAVLSGLECVDYCVSFDEETPLELICALRPDVLVKGSDYNVSEIVGSSEVISWGGEVKTIDLTKNVSTTKIIEKILNI